MTSLTTEGNLTDLTFLHDVYRHHGMFVHPSIQESMDNHAEASKVAEDLLDELEHRDRGEFPALEIPDPGKRLETITVRLAVMSFEAIERQNLLKPLYPSYGTPLKYKKANVDARAIVSEDEPDGRTVGSLSISGHENYTSVDEVRLSRYVRRDKVVSGHPAAVGEGITYNYEAMNFLGMVATYLAKLKEE